MLPIAAQAQTHQINATVTDTWVTTQKRIPIRTQVCEQIQVPVYQESKPDGGAVILGAIIGNAIGRAAGVSGGQTAGTVIGGIAGAEISKNNQKIDRFETRHQCKFETTYQDQTTEEYGYSTVEFYHNGRLQRLRFKK